MCVYWATEEDQPYAQSCTPNSKKSGGQAIHSPLCHFQGSWKHSEGSGRVVNGLGEYWSI